MPYNAIGGLVDAPSAGCAYVRTKARAAMGDVRTVERVAA